MAGLGGAGLGRHRHETARQTWLGKARPGGDRRAGVRLGMAWQVRSGMARPALAGSGKARPGRLGLAWHGLARHGRAGQGAAGQGRRG